MALGAGDVRHVAALARLALEDAEVDELVRQLGHILEHIERLRACDTDGVPPTARALSLTAGRYSALRTRMTIRRSRERPLPARYP